MERRVLIFLIFAVLGCQGQYERNSRQGNRARESQRGSQDNSDSNRRFEKRDESKSKYHNCLTTKGCFGLPSGCVGRQDCTILLIYQHREAQREFHFTMIGRLEPDTYMAMGLSYDNKMGDDAVTECFLKENIVTLRESWNEGRTNTRTKELEQENYQSLYRDGWSQCEWIEDYTVTNNNRFFNLANTTYHILLAQGPMQGNRIGYHTIGRLSSQEAVNFTAFEAIAGEGISPSVKIHDETSPMHDMTSSTHDMTGHSTEDSVLGKKRPVTNDEHVEDHSSAINIIGFSFKYSVIAIALAALTFPKLLR